MVVAWQNFEMFHNRRNVGSTRIRVHNLIKYWPEAKLYEYGDKADVLIFQKVYCTYDYKLPKHYPGITILDACDIEWHNTPDIYIKETLDAVDAVVVPTDNFRKLLQQMTDTPVRIIKDRFDMSEFPRPKQHDGQLKRAVWFGYAHNAELLRFAIPSLEKRGIELLVVSNEDPTAYKWADDPEAYAPLYNYVHYDQATAYINIQLGDVCLLPKGYRPEDRYKSENKAVIAQLLGLPVVSDAEELDAMADSQARNEAIEKVYESLRNEYNCERSVSEYCELIAEIERNLSGGQGKP